MACLLGCGSASPPGSVDETKDTRATVASTEVVSAAAGPREAVLSPAGPTVRQEELHTGDINALNPSPSPPSMPSSPEQRAVSLQRPISESPAGPDPVSERASVYLANLSISEAASAAVAAAGVHQAATLVGRAGLGKDYFYDLFGIRESTYAETKKQLIYDARVHTLTGPNGDTWYTGVFSTPSLGELIEVVNAKGLKQKHRGSLSLRIVMGDVSALQAQNPYATFQAASQFNCLEFASPGVIPEMGVTRYADDRTQGPACSIGCGPATVFRNYYVPVPIPGTNEVQEGQTAPHQLNMMADLSAALGNDDGKYFQVKNGYTTAKTTEALEQLNARIAALSPEEQSKLQEKLRIGVHDDVQVTSYQWGRVAAVQPAPNADGSPSYLSITQVFGAACSIAYTRQSTEAWEPLAVAVLKASYRATLHAALLAAERHNGEPNAHVVFLTLLGAGVFGNEIQWVADAIRGACEELKDVKLDVRIVCFAPPIAPCLRQLEADYPVARAAVSTL